MSAMVSGGVPWVQLRDKDGYTYRFDTLGEDGQASPVVKQPQEPFDQISIIGNTEQVNDRLASQVIPGDSSGGSGRRQYNETEGITDYSESDLDTRHGQVQVARPERTALAGTLPATTAHWKIIHVGRSGGATLHAIDPNQVGRYYTGLTWTAWTGPTTRTRGHVQALGYIYTLNQGTRKLCRSADGITFTDVGAALGATGNVIDCAFFDAKIYALFEDTTNDTLGLYVYTDAAAAAPSNATAVVTISWKAGQGDVALWLTPWYDAGGSPTLFVITARQVLGHNPVASNLIPYDDFSESHAAGVSTATWVPGVHAIVFNSTRDLYVAQGNAGDYLMRYTAGAGFGKVGPGQNGGLSRIRQGYVQCVAQNAYGLGVWTRGRAGGPGGGTTSGQAWFYDGRGWHPINRAYDASGPTKGIWGGGIGNGAYYTVFDDGTVESQQFPTRAALPQYATDGRYDTIATGMTHRYARTDGGTELSRKTLLGFTVHSLIDDGTDKFDLNNDCFIKVQYQLDGGTLRTVEQYVGSDGVVRTVSGGLFSAAMTAADWPLRTIVGPTGTGAGGTIPGGLGYPFYELDWQYTVYTIDANNTPVVRSVSPRYVRTPPPHYTYECVVDLLRLGGDSLTASNMGRRAISVARVLESLDHTGYMFELKFGGPGLRETVRTVEFAMAPQILPHLGVGKYRLVFKDVSTDPSGQNGA